jgi:glutamyl-tRNA reductase
MGNHSSIMLSLMIPHQYSTMAKESTYNEEDLEQCTRDIYNLVLKAPTSDLKAVYNKFAKEKYGSISTKFHFGYH